MRFDAQMLLSELYRCVDVAVAFTKGLCLHSCELTLDGLSAAREHENYSKLRPSCCNASTSCETSSYMTCVLSVFPEGIWGHMALSHAVRTCMLICHCVVHVQAGQAAHVPADRQQ